MAQFQLNAGVQMPRKPAFFFRNKDNKKMWCDLSSFLQIASKSISTRHFAYPPSYATDPICLITEKVQNKAPSTTILLDITVLLEIEHWVELWCFAWEERMGYVYIYIYIVCIEGWVASLLFWRKFYHIQKFQWWNWHSSVISMVMSLFKHLPLGIFSSI